MGTQMMLREESVSISDLRKSPEDYFTDHAIAVLSNNRPVGYVIGAKAYESMLAVITQLQETTPFERRFKPTAMRMQAILEKGTELLANATEKDLVEYKSTE